MNALLRIAIVTLCSLTVPAVGIPGEQVVTTPDSSYIDVDVREMAGITGRRAVTGGVPIPRGAAPSGSRFTLADESGTDVPCQSAVLATWEDGSARWVLLDFQANPQRHATKGFRLRWGHHPAKDVLPAQPAKATDGKSVSIRSGNVRIQAVPHALVRISDRFDVHLVLTDRHGARAEAMVNSAVIETAGPLRSTMALSGSFTAPGGGRIIDFRLRASVYAGLGQFYLEPQIIVNADTGMISHIRDLNLEIKPVNGYRDARIGGIPGWQGTPSAQHPVRLFQTDDENYRLEGADGKGAQAPGWMEIGDGEGCMAIALRDFWQQWPKSLEAAGESARVGLFPSFDAGEFDHMEPWYKYDYLFESNTYRLRQGQSRRWQIWADLSGNGEHLVQSINQPLVPIANPQQAISTGEWGPIAAAGTKGMEVYDAWAERLFEGYRNSIKEQRDYGAMNWGDWWGERQVNWGNHEYDTPLHLLIQFARTGDPKYFYVAERSVRHMAEVDVVHSVNDDLKAYFSRWERPEYPSRPGMVHEHSVGHVGGFHPVEKIRELYVGKGIGGGNPNPYLCLDPYNLGHIWTLGMAHHYLLTGDPWVKETVERIGDNLMRLTEDGQYGSFKGTSHSGRISGWTMLALAGAHKINPTDRSLKAMRFIAEEALVEQNPVSGGWMYPLPWGHCNCVSIADRKKGIHPHVGEAGFITAVRLNGLAYYYRLTGDPRIPASLLHAVTNLNHDTWHDHRKGWRYTSCPATATSVNQSGVTIMALVNSAGINADREQLRILKKAWDARFQNFLENPLETKPGIGKSYSTIMYGAPEAMNLFINGSEKLERNAD